MIVSTLSVFFKGSNSTRLFRQGITGHTLEIVEVSWMAKPWDRSSRSIMLRTPPDFGVGDAWGVGDVGGVWLAAGAVSATATRTMTTVENRAKRTRDMGTSRINWASRSLRENAGADKPVSAPARAARVVPRDALPPSVEPVSDSSVGSAGSAGAAPLPRCSNQPQQEVDRVEQPARQSADDRAVDADVLEVVAGVVLDESHRAFGAEGAHAVLDELGEPLVVALDRLDRARFHPLVELLAEVLVAGQRPAGA